MEEKTEVLSLDNIYNRVYCIRGQQVMLDSDLAEIYGYEVKNLNRQVKRNIERFPEDFMFQLTEEENKYLRCQNGTANMSTMSRSLPYAFTEQGIYMLATVLRGDLAEQQSIFIMRAFREMRHYIKHNPQFATQSEMRLVAAKVSEVSVQMAGVSDRQKKAEESIREIQKSIDSLKDNFVSEDDFKNFVIYKGQKFEADVAYIACRNGFLTTSVVNDFANQYPPLKIKPNPDCHDRLIVIDYGLPTEQAYHCGASSKDAGNKLCAINRIDKTIMIHPVIDKLLLLSDKMI